MEPSQAPKVENTDNSLAFGRACEVLSWNHRTSTPHRSETNGIAERAVRPVKEGTSAVLLQSGQDERWWADSMECYCYLRNVQGFLADGKTPHGRRFGEPFKGPIKPFGGMVEYHPTSPKDQSRVHQFGKKVLPAIFLGFELIAGRMWKGDVCSRRRLTKIQTTTRPDHVCPEVWTTIGKAAQNREKQDWAKGKPKLDNARRLRGIYFIDPDDREKRKKKTGKTCGTNHAMQKDDSSQYHESFGKAQDWR